MTLRVTLSVLEIVLVVAVLAYFLIRLAQLVTSISTNLAKVTWGVRTVEVQCRAIGPAADTINANLSAAAANLEQAASAAERLGR